MREGDGIAGAARSLVSNATSEIKTIDIPEIKLLWQLGLGNTGRRGVLLLKVLEFAPGLSEFVTLTKLLCLSILFTIECLVCSDKVSFLALLLVVCLRCLRQAHWPVLLLITLVRVVHVVVRLEHANVGLPAEVSTVDGLNQQIHLVRWHVVVVRIATLAAGALVHLHAGASGGLGAGAG